MFGVFRRLFTPRSQEEKSDVSNEIVARHGVPVDPTKKYLPVLKNGGIIDSRRVVPRSATRNSGVERVVRNNQSNPYDIRPGGKRPIKRDAERAHEGMKVTPTTEYGEILERVQRAAPQRHDGGYIRARGFSEEKVNGDLDRAPLSRSHNKLPQQHNVHPGAQRVGLATIRDDKLFGPHASISRAKPAATHGNSIRQHGPGPVHKAIY